MANSSLGDAQICKNIIKYSIYSFFNCQNTITFLLGLVVGYSIYN